MKPVGRKRVLGELDTHRGLVRELLQSSVVWKLDRLVMLAGKRILLACPLRNPRQAGRITSVWWCDESQKVLLVMI